MGNYNHNNDYTDIPVYDDELHDAVYDVGDGGASCRVYNPDDHCASICEIGGRHDSSSVNCDGIHRT